MAYRHHFQSIGIVGAGSMGSQMAIAFADLGLQVSIWDCKTSNIERLMRDLQADKQNERIRGFDDIHEFVRSLVTGNNKRKLFMFSITHGDPADSVLDMISDDLSEGDIVLDGGNEFYRRTEARQRRCAERGVHWIGMGVSGGYQAARRGPSLSPGGDAEALDLVMPLLQQYAAKDPRSGLPCVARIGPAGAGHYVKMAHNFIEGGMLSTLAEAWSLMHFGLGLSYDQVADIFGQWNKEGPLRHTYLLDIGEQLLRTRKTPEGDRRGEGAGDSSEYVLDDVLDKVVQDDDNSEGTPHWALMESAQRHVATPTNATAHYLRVVSGNRKERLAVAKKLRMAGPGLVQGVQDTAAFLETLQAAVYCGFLVSNCEGLELIARASQDEHWDIDPEACLQIWRNGCIIQSGYILDLLQDGLFGTTDWTNLKLVNDVAVSLHSHVGALKEVVLQGIRTDQYIPALSAALEYLKYTGGTRLPTQFMQGQMDLFGAHGYNKPGVPGEDPGPTSKGPHHYEWRPA
ncbi:6-phosphogluconate dehydrogenase [Aspergillus taichungensis]|uniref:phosphogluconate dehydrogenase (NADP(+)-dependent, decarboxylating) n=1 Tax=Aspergillus taichungensis TaxID=482145 RepID=A0A2J5HX59_9EURO|nr:6-phosphogluconate dehydrogenase [Aspergillus taichungensis]